MVLKYFILLFIILGTFHNCNNSVSKTDSKLVCAKNENDKTAAELYEKSLYTLDSIVRHSETNDDFAGFKAIEILSKISGYGGGGDKNYYGTFGFKDEDLVYWKNWYEENKDSLHYFFHMQSSIEFALNIDKYYVVKVDSLRNFYLVYLIKTNSVYKVVSEKIGIRDNCEKIKTGDFLSLSLKSIVPDTSKISYKVDGILYKGTEFDFERDSVLDIYEADEFTGLCYFKRVRE